MRRRRDNRRVPRIKIYTRRCHAGTGSGPGTGRRAPLRAWGTTGPPRGPPPPLSLPRVHQDLPHKTLHPHRRLTNPVAHGGWATFILANVRFATARPCQGTACGGRARSSRLPRLTVATPPPPGTGAEEQVAHQSCNLRGRVSTLFILTLLVRQLVLLKTNLQLRFPRHVFDRTATVTFTFTITRGRRRYLGLLPPRR